MAKYYVRPGVTAGTGSGTVSDPWNINDVMTAANPKGLTSYTDKLLLQTTGADTYSLTASLDTMIAGIFFGATDYSGNPTDNQADVYADPATLVNCINVQDVNCIFAGISFRGGSAEACYVGQDSIFFFKCGFVDSGGQGLELATGSEGVMVIGCNAQDNALEGIRALLTNGGGNFIEQCYVSNNDGNVGQIHITTGVVHNNIIEVKAGVIDNHAGIASSTQGFRGVIKNNTINFLGDAGASTVSGMYFPSIANSGVSIVSNNIVTNAKGTGGAVHAFRMPNDSNGFGRFTGNVAYNCDVTVDSNIPNSAIYEACDTSNPDFVDAANSDYTPQTNLLSISDITKIALESDWIDPGALSHLLVGSSGGGLPILAPSGIVRA